MRVLIIGINGFLGRELAKECLNRGIEVEGIYHKDKIFIPYGCFVSPYTSLGHFRDDYDAVFITSAVIPRSGSTIPDSEMIAINTQLPFQIALQFPRSFCVFTSSVSIYGYPHLSTITERTMSKNPNFYGMTKLAAESLLGRYHENSAIIRFSSLYGPEMHKETFLPRIIADAKRTRVITLFGDGSRKQDYLHVRDAAALCLIAAVKKRAGTYLGVYGKSYTNRSVADIVCSYIRGCMIRYHDIDKNPSYSYDASYTRKNLGFIPSITLKNGISEMI